MTGSGILGTAILLAQAVPLDCLQLHVPLVPAFRSRGGGVFLPSQRPSDPRRRRAAAAPARPASPTVLRLLKGLVPTVDDDIRIEIEEAELSSLEVFRQELDSGVGLPAAVAAAAQRRKDKAGDYENKFKILSDSRSYGNRDLLDSDHFSVPPSLEDLNQQPPDQGKVLWVTGTFRAGVFASAYLLFPVVCNLLKTLVDVTDDEFDIINDQFTPGIGILYGTFVALTLDILYERQGKVQENASVEASLLSQVTQNVINLFQNERNIGREACQIIADQVRIIVYRSRGSEMLTIMRADPYARLLSIVDHYQRDKLKFTPHEEALIDGLRNEIPALMEARARRLSDEASSLPPTHFLVLIVLTSLSLIGFTAATLTITDADGSPPLESRMVFAGLSAIYVLFYNFCKDMNDPFDGVYQIKRSSAAAYLLQTKWLIANQPYGEDVKFDTRGLAPVYDGNEEDEVGKGPSKVDPSSSIQQSPTLATAARDPAWAVTAVHAPSPSGERLPTPPETVSDPEERSQPQQKVMSSTKVIHSSGILSASEAAIKPEKKAESQQDVLTFQKTAAPSSVIPPTPSQRAIDTEEKSKPHQEAVVFAKASAAVAPSTSESKVAPPRQAPQATDFLPPRPVADAQAPSETAQEEALTAQFESLSGFSGEPSTGGDVTVTTNRQRSLTNRKQISMQYFRKAGGFVR